MVNAFKGKATRYFVAVKQQSRFKTACNGLKTSARKLILLANVHVYHSFQELSNEPAGLRPRGVAARLRG